MKVRATRQVTEFVDALDPEDQSALIDGLRDLVDAIARGENPGTPVNWDDLPDHVKAIVEEPAIDDFPLEEN